MVSYCVIKVNNMSAQHVFNALADPTRRSVIAMLANKAMTVNQISERFDMSRPAVAKHLKILQKGKIISVKTVGRSRINTLRPEALKSVADWVNYYSSFWDENLMSLKDTIESKQEK